jgi:predicted DsbA family dithiol-disulfide isomerase
MATLPPRLWLDLVDPLSWLQDEELRAAEEAGVPAVVRSPLELRPPPAPLLDPGEESWTRRQEAAAAVAEPRGRTLRPPSFIPWSRKAWELVFHAREVEREAEVRRALLRAFHEEGRDLGRVDVLVELAVGLGLDRTRTKAVLDVDRHAAAVAAEAEQARELDATVPPALWTGTVLVEGFHDRDALRTLLIS